MSLFLKQIHQLNLYYFNWPHGSSKRRLFKWLKTGPAPSWGGAVGGPGLVSGGRPDLGLGPYVHKGQGFGPLWTVGSATVLGLGSAAVMEPSNRFKRITTTIPSKTSLFFCVWKGFIVLVSLLPHQTSVHRKYNFLLLKHSIKRQSTKSIQ